MATTDEEKGPGAVLGLGDGQGRERRRFDGAARGGLLRRPGDLGADLEVAEGGDPAVGRVGAAFDIRGGKEDAVEAKLGIGRGGRGGRPDERGASGDALIGAIVDDVSALE
jgi:hypothetical protein